MEEDKIVLDRKSFEALAVDTRVKILKSLKQRRKTLTEIAKEQEMSVSGIKEHLEVLEKTGLIEKFDDGHKWKYYELTKKGKEIVGPKEVRVLILLSTSIVTFILSALVLLAPSIGPSALLAEQDSAVQKAVTVEEPAYEAPKAGAQESYKDPQEVVSGADANIEEEPPMAAPAEEPLAGEAPRKEALLELPVIPIAVAVVSVLTILGCAAILIRNRMR